MVFLAHIFIDNIQRFYVYEQMTRYQQLEAQTPIIIKSHIINTHSNLFMDIQFIEEEHRDNIFKIMELCSVDMAEAYALYTNAGNNLENAVQTKFSQNLNSAQNYLSHDIPQRSYEEAFVPNSNSHFNDFGYGGQQKIQDQALEYTNYKIFKQQGLNFSKRYGIRRSEGIAKRLLPKFLKPSSEQHFKKKLEEIIKRKSNLRVGTGTFSESLQSIAKSKFPLVVHAFDFNPSLSQKLRQIYTDQQFIQTVFNTQYQNYGLDCKQYQLEDFLKDMVNLKTDKNSIIIMRINILDTIQVLAKIKVEQLSIADLKKRIKQIKSKCIQLQMEELQLQKRYKEELKGNLDYQKPISMAEKRKIQEDRQIRRKQEEQFFQAMKPKPTDQKRQTNMDKRQNLDSNQKVQPTINSSKPKKQDILKSRKQLRQSLTLYTEGPGTILIKLRMPSGESLKLYVGGNQSGKYLFDYVNGLQSQQLGFQNDLNRSFDIIRPYDKLNLSQKMRESLKATFQDSDMESLVVNEKL